MQEIVNMHQAKTHFSKLIAKVRLGEIVVIAMGGKPVARLVPIAQQVQRQPGSAEGLVEMSDDFNDPLPEAIVGEFYR